MQGTQRWYAASGLGAKGKARVSKNRGTRQGYRTEGLTKDLIESTMPQFFPTHRPQPQYLTCGCRVQIPNHSSLFHFVEFGALVRFRNFPRTFQLLFALWSTLALCEGTVFMIHAWTSAPIFNVLAQSMNPECTVHLFTLLCLVLWSTFIAFHGLFGNFVHFDQLSHFVKKLFSWCRWCHPSAPCPLLSSTGDFPMVLVPLCGGPLMASP